MKEIRLTQNKVALVDDEDFDYLNQFKWYALKSRNTFYAQRTKVINGKECTLKMHRVIMQTPNNLEVDYIDHNGLNCQKSNMRNCTFAENRRNRCAWGFSKYLGVTKIKKNKYIARIRTNGKLIHLGCFDSEKDAAYAYDLMANELFGQFANLNFK